MPQDRESIEAFRELAATYCEVVEGIEALEPTAVLGCLGVAATGTDVRRDHAAGR
jgi:hypothetical protein